MSKYHPAPRYLFRRYEILKNLKKGSNFLEIGAGNFQLSTELLNYFNTGTALDFHPEIDKIYSELSINTQNRLNIKNCNFLTTNFNETFDCIISCEVMEHITKDKEFLKKIYNLLNPKGQVIISVPAKMKYWSIHDEITGHIKRYEKVELLNLFGTFEQVKIISYGYPFINLLRFPRILLAQYQHKKLINLSQEQLTKTSGMARLPIITRLLINKYFFFPFNIIAGLFNNFDFSEGYLVVAEKPAKKP